MAILSGYFHSKNGDRRYNADEMSRYFAGLISSGVLANYQGKLMVSATTGMNIKIGTGRAYFSDGKFIENTADISLIIDPSDVALNRIDRIVLKKDINENIRESTIVLKKGTPAVDPVASDVVRDAYVEELSLATIYVGKLVEEITQANITDTRPDSAVCGYVTGLIDQLDISEAYAQYIAQTEEILEEQQQEFDDWFVNIKDTLASATLIRGYYSNYVPNEDYEENIPIQIPLYNRLTDIMQVYINGMRVMQDYDYTIISNEYIKLTNPVRKYNIISFEVFKSMDGTGVESVVDTVEMLEEDYLRKAKYEYHANGLDDNVKLSQLAQDFLIGKGDYVGVAENIELVIDVYGTLSASAPFVGSGSAEDPFIWFMLGKYNNAHTSEDSTTSTRKITFDFTHASRISLGSEAGQHTVMIGGNDVNIKCLQAVLGGDGSTLNWFNGQNVHIDDSMLWLNAQSTAIGSTSGGTFERCRLSLTSISGKANCLVSDGTSILKVLDCYIICYNGTSAADESICVLVEEDKNESVVIVERCNMPLITRDGYKQSQTIKINSGYCSLISNILGQATTKYSTDVSKCTEVGTMIISKQ